MEDVLPGAAPAAEAGAQAVDAAALEQQAQQPEGAGGEQAADKPEGEGGEKKPEKTPEQRELERARRKIDRLVRQREELRARLESGGLQRPPIERDNPQDDSDSERLTLSRAELEARIREEATKLAPAMREQQAAIEHRQKVVSSLAKTWGQEKFDSYAADLDEAFGGLADAKGQPKPATDAIFEADDPAALIEYLADPENADEAEALGRMSAVRAGMRVAQIAAKIAARKAEAKPQASKAATPIEPARGGGKPAQERAPTDIKAYMKWANQRYGRT